jgi:hypothetical protein
MGVQALFDPFRCLEAAGKTCQDGMLHADTVKVIRIDEERDQADGYPGGFMPGDRVFFVGAQQVFPNGDTLKFGDEGSVEPFDGERVKANSIIKMAPVNTIIKVVFDKHEDFTRVRVCEISRDPPQIPGGHAVGDTVFWAGGSEVFASGDNLRPGLKGQVAGKATQAGLSDQEAVAVRFDGNRWVTDVPLCKLTRSAEHPKVSDEKPYATGDVVYWTGAGQTFPGGDQVCFGHWGVVVTGHLIQDATEKGGDRVKVQFLGNACYTAVCVSQLSREVPVLPEGYSLGNRVRWTSNSKVFSNGDVVTCGLEGEVQGRAARRNDGLDEQRVVVKFAGHAKHHPVCIDALRRISRDGTADEEWQA